MTIPWEPDYADTPIGQPAVLGYRGPIPLEPAELSQYGRPSPTSILSSLVRQLMTPAPLVDAFSEADDVVAASVEAIAGADRVIIAWSDDKPAAVLAFREARSENLSGWHLTDVMAPHTIAGAELLERMIGVLVAEEPTDFVSAMTNDPMVYRAIRSIAPGGVMYPNHQGRYGAELVRIGHDVVESVYGKAAVPLLRHGLTWRGHDTTRHRVPNAPWQQFSRSRSFRELLALDVGDAAFVLADRSGVVGMAARFSSNMHRLDLRERVRTVAVTGTNGKTSFVELGRQLAEAGGIRSASYGTLGLTTSQEKNRMIEVGVGPTGMPRLLEQAHVQGIETVWLEAFSYALSRGLFDQTPIDVAAFTQLGMDHLRSHRTAASYRAAKHRLFAALVKSDGTVVVDPSSEGAAGILDIAEQRNLKVIRVGATHGIEADATHVRIGRRVTPCAIPFTESVMFRNLELAIGAAMALGLNPAGFITAVEELILPPGRFHRLELNLAFTVAIDAAHNADALEASLSEWRTRTTGRLLLVIGSGEHAREPARWEPLGEVAGVLADLVVVTDEGRDQGDAYVIRAAIRRGCPSSTEIPDRAQAIRWAISEARPGDTIIIAGRADEGSIDGADTTAPYLTDEALVHQALVGSASAPRPIDS